jgi:peptidyl-prolyl cis-trans isomerase C
MPIKVDGELIPDSAIEYEFNRLVKFYSDHMPPSKVREQVKTLRQRAVDQAIGAKLLMKQAERLDLPVSAGDVDERFDELVKQAGGEKPFEAMLKAQRLSAAAVKSGIERGRRVDLLVEQVLSEVPEPTEQEVRAHFDANSDQHVRPDRAQAQHILIRADPGKPSEMKNARHKLGDIRRKIEAGADFAEMAAAHSECPSGRKAGGSLGWFDRGAMVPEFDAAVFSMEVGRVSEIVETSLGVHLIRKTAGEEGGPAELADVSDRIREFLRHTRRGEALSTYVNELKSKAVIEGV